MGRLQSTHVLSFRILLGGALISGALLNVAYSQGFFSSLTQAVRAGFDPMEVRGHFDVGAQRYYCLTDTKTKVNQPNAVQGYIATSPDGSPHFKQTAVSMLSCDAVEKRGQLIYDSQPTQDAPQSSTTSISAPASDPGTWNVLGVKIGEGADDAFHSILAQYPKAVRVNGRIKPRVGQFDAGEEVITGATIVDGLATAPGFDGRYYTDTRGGDNLGQDSEKDVLAYIWPSNGAVVLISRAHVYGRSNGLISGAPTIAAIRASLLQKFGPPNIERVKNNSGADQAPVGGTSGFQLNIGSTYDDPPGYTWVWSAHATLDMHNPGVWDMCKQRINAIVATATMFPVPGTSPPTVTLGNGNAQCGTLMIVYAETQGSDEFPSQLTQILFDDGAFQQASVALRAHFNEREKEALEKAKKAGDSAKPVL